MRKILFALSLCLGMTLQAQETATTHNLENKGGKYICAGSIDCNRDDKTSYAAAVLWTLEQDLPDNDQKDSKEFDIEKMKLAIKPVVSASAGNAWSYTFLLNIGVKNEKMTFVIEKVRAIPNNALGVLGAISLDKINLAKKPQHQIYIDDFAKICPEFVNEMLTDIQNREVNLKHWDAIVKGQVVQGMDESEVKLSVGNPESITENSQRTLWTYTSGLIIAFEEGIVTGVVK